MALVIWENKVHFLEEINFFLLFHIWLHKEEKPKFSGCLLQKRQIGRVIDRVIEDLTVGLQWLMKNR